MVFLVPYQCQRWAGQRQATLAALLLLTPVFALAHHSTAPYDLIHGTIIQGVVTRFDLINPHGNISLDVTGEDGVIERWTVAIDGAGVLGRLGWTKDSLKQGERITVTGNRAKDGSFHLRGVGIRRQNGQALKALPLPDE